MFLEIVTPDKNIFSGDIVSVSFPGSNGEFGIQENHAPIVATLKEGKIKESFWMTNALKQNKN